MLRGFAVLLAVLGLVYAGICAWVAAHQRALLYFPQATRVDAAATDFSIARDGATLRGWRLDLGDGDPILYFGGNAERIERNRDDFARWFAGHPVYLLAYRGYGASDGSPEEALLHADALALYDAVRARHPGRPVHAIGRSLGSGVASELATRRPIGKLALVTPYDSMEAVARAHYGWLPIHWLIRDRYPSACWLRGFTGPVLVLRAGRDEVIPAASTDRLVAALPRPPRVVAIAEADHNDISGFPAYGEALAGFLR